ncbi:MAG: DUF5924 family protein [Gammaproteobacteria bacterium]
MTIPSPSVQARSIIANLERIALLAHRYRYALAPVSFGIGLASFFLIQRREGLAEWIAILLLLVWLAGQAEATLGRHLKVAPGILRFFTQQAHQETFFFTLPFLLRTTSWDSGQAIFTGSVIVAALCSMWDPLYFGRIASRRWLLLLFHVLAIYLTMLIALPLVLNLTTGQTLRLSAAAVVILALPSLPAVIGGHGLRRWAAILAGALVFGMLAWAIRPWVPPAVLWIGEGAVTQTVDVDNRTPGPALRTVTPRELVNQGLYAYTAIHAPRGLNERVYHRWLQDGREIEQIPLDIVGGRENGYRVWSHKELFPAEPSGAWLVQTVTESGQLIGQMRFRVTDEYNAPGPKP